MTLVQIWENEKDMALQKYVYDHTAYIIIGGFIWLFASILYQINIY